MAKYRSIKNGGQQIHIGKSKAVCSVICRKHPNHRQSSGGVCSVCLTEKLTQISTTNNTSIHHRMASLFKSLRSFTAARHTGKGFFYTLLHSRTRRNKNLCHESKSQIRWHFRFSLLWHRKFPFQFHPSFTITLFVYCLLIDCMLFVQENCLCWYFHWK